MNEIEVKAFQLFDKVEIDDVFEWNFGGEFKERKKYICILIGKE